MLEGLLATVLNRFLGVYVKNFDPNQLKIGIWNGDVKLQSLELRREALDQLHLPLNVVGGHIEKLTLQVPWSNLQGKPVKINIEDVFLLAVPRTDAGFDPREDEERAFKVKMDKLNNAELLKDRADTDGMSPEDQQKKESFTTSLVTAVVDNVQVQIKNIHIRYEDSISDPGHPFALGFTLEAFEATSTDENWIPTFIQSSAGQVSHKLGTLESLAVYWDTDVSLLGPGNSQNRNLPVPDYLEKMKSMIVHSGDEATLGNHQYLLKPVTGRAQFEINKTGKLDLPKIRSNLQFDELGFVMDDTQYRDALMLVDLFHYYIRRQEYRKYEPTTSIKKDPKAWFRFAGQVVLDRIRERNRRWTWDYIRQRRDDRRQYLALFKKRKREETLSSIEAAEIEALERKYSYEDLRFWRSLARSQLRKEKVKVNKAPVKQTWSQWIWGGAHSRSKEADNDEGDENEESTEFTDQQRKELYDAIDWDEKKMLAEAVDVPEEYVKFEVDLSLERGSLTLKKDPHRAKLDIVRLVFDSFRTKALIRRNSIFADLTLEAMRLFDGSTPGTRFPQLISIKDVPELGTGPGQGEGAIVQSPIRKSNANPLDDPFFRLTFEHNPLDHSADNSLSVKLKAMEILYNPQFLVAIVKFFRPPEMHMESIGVLMETAGEAVEGIRRQTRAGLELALEEHKTLNLTLDLHAPLIVVPDSVTDESSLCLILDAGRIRMRSDLADKAALKKIQGRNQHNEEDLRRLESLMYDKFLLKLTSTQVLLGTTVDDTRVGLTDPGRRLHIIDRINIDFDVEMCIVPKTTSLTKFRVKGHLPILHVNVSDTKYRNLMKLIDFAIPNFDDHSEEDRTRLLAPPLKHKPSIEQQAILSRPRGLSLSLSQPLLFFTDDDSSSMNDGSDSDGGLSTPASSVDERPLKSKKAVNWTQRTFDFTFTVAKLQGSVYRSNDLLVDLVAENFFFQFFSRPYDFDANVRLQRFYVEDHVEKNPIPGLSNLVTSASLSGESQDLLSVHVVKVDPESPDFEQKYEGIGINVDVNISTINVVVSRTTLLTLLDFVLVTFTDQNSDQDSHHLPQHQKLQVLATANGEAPSSTAIVGMPIQTDRIRVKAELKEMAFILNNDGVRLATFSLESASVVVRLKDKTMAIDAQLGDLLLVDDVDLSVPASSPTRRLLSIKRNEITRFHYETFDPAAHDFPGYDLMVSLRASMTVNWILEPFRSIIEFMVRFGKMQAFFNAAREAATQRVQEIQRSTNRIKFDILFDNPTVVFPRDRDSLTANLGEVRLRNEFKPDGEHNMLNEITAELKRSRFQSCFAYQDGSSFKKETLNLIDGANIEFHATISEQEGRQHFAVTGTMSDTQIHLTQQQVRFVADLAREAPRLLDIKDISEDQTKDVTAIPFSGEEEKPDSTEISPTSPPPPPGGTSASFRFSVGHLGLELISAPLNQPVGSRPSLASFGLDQLLVTFSLDKESVVRSELKIESFALKDCRAMAQHQNKSVKQTLDSSIDISKPDPSLNGGRRILARVTIHQPQVILSLDFVLGLKSFIDASTSGPNFPSQDQGLVESGEGDRVQEATTGAQSEADSSTNAISLDVTVIKSQVVLLANPGLASTEAIVLETSRINLVKQNTVNLSVENVGMFLCRMDRMDVTRMRILNDFNLILNVLTNSLSGGGYKTVVHAEVDPLVIRVSLRDILMVMQIVNKANERTEKEGVVISAPRIEERSRKASRPSLPPPDESSSSSVSVPRRSFRKSAIKHLTPNQPPSAVIQIEEFSATIQPARLVIIGDSHALPMLDFQLNKFDIEAKNWSTNLSAYAPINLALNVYNFSKSAWEPLIEPWKAEVQMERAEVGLPITMSLTSSVRLEATITAAMVSTAIQCSGFLTSNEDVLSKPREDTAPYRIRNLTGLDINVWGVSDAVVPKGNSRSTSSHSPSAITISNGSEVSWRFEDSRMTRDTLNPNWATGTLGVTLQESGFNSVTGIPVQQEGETIHVLHPDRNKVQYRMLVEVRLGKDNVKQITFRSPFQIQNCAKVAAEIGVTRQVSRGTTDEWQIFQIRRIEPGETFPIGVLDAFTSAFVIRVKDSEWSEVIRWDGNNGLISRPTRVVDCQREGRRFVWHVHSVYDHTNPLTREYPYMTVKLLPPVRIQNLLPVEAVFKVYDQERKVTWRSRVDSGATVSVHAVSADNTLVLTLETDDQQIEKVSFRHAETEGALIGSHDPEALERDKELKLIDPHDRMLRLKLQYHEDKDSGGAFRVSVYSPYVIMNRTGRSIQIQSVGMFGMGVEAAGGGGCATGGVMMFNFPSDERKNRALVRVEGSQWSKPTSFDTLGSANQVSLLEEGGSSKREFQLGLDVREGEGPFRLVKVVTFVPRFVIHNTLGREIYVRMSSESEFQRIPPNDVFPLDFIRKVRARQNDGEGSQRPDVFLISFCLPGAAGVWSEPLDIERPKSQIKLRRGDEYLPIGLNVVVEGASQTLVIARPPNAAESESIAKTGSLVDAEMQSAEVRKTEHTLFRLGLAGVGLSLVSSREILYATATGISATVTDSKADTSLSMSIDMLQVDNQLHGALEPIVLTAISSPEDGTESVISAALSRSKLSTSQLTIIPFCTFLVQRLALVLDEDFAFALLDFIRDANIGSAPEEEDEGFQVAGKGEQSMSIPVAKSDGGNEANFLFQHLFLQPIMIDFSFSRSQRLNSDDAVASAPANPLGFLVHVLSFSLGQINNAPIKYHALVLENAQLSLDNLMSAVKSHYIQESLSQVHYVLGSADVLGNPVGLFNHLTSGIADIFYEPYRGLVATDHPRDVGIGLAKGASSFVQKSVFGVSDSFARFTGSLSNGLAAATRDREYQTQRRISHARSRPAHALKGVEYGGNALVSGVLQGITDLGRLPIQGAEKDGLTGLVRGVGKGFLGAFTKPAIGALDMASNVAEGVRNTTTVFNSQAAARVRPPRYIPRSGIVGPYDLHRAQGQLWLKQANNGAYFDAEYLGHFLIQASEGSGGNSSRASSSSAGGGDTLSKSNPGPADVAAMKTASFRSARLLFITYTSLIMLFASSLEENWKVPFLNIAKITKERSGINITLSDGQAGPFLPAPSREVRNEMHRCIVIAVTAWNNRWNT